MIDVPQVLAAFALGWELRWPVAMATVLATFPWWTTRPLRTFTGNVLELYNFRSVTVLGAVNLLATASVIASTWLTLALHGAAEVWPCLPLALVGVPTPFAALVLLPRRPYRNRLLMALGLLFWTAAAPVTSVVLATWMQSDLRGLSSERSWGDLGLAHLSLAATGGLMLLATWITAVLHAPNRVKQRTQVAAGVWLLSIVALAAALLPGIFYWGRHLGWLEATLVRAGVDARGIGAVEPPVEFVAVLLGIAVTVWLGKRHPPTLRGAPRPPSSDWSEHTAALTARLGQQRERPVAVVIAAQGGGIQAAAWTTRVLHGLNEQIPGFYDKVVFASGTSGGAVGIAWMAASCVEGPPGRGLARAERAARVGSLDALGWGTVYLDGVGAVWERRRGRGWALEEDWRGIAREHGIPVVSLGGLREAVARGDLPIPVLHATVLESGGPLTFCPFGLPPIDDRTTLPNDWWETKLADIDWFSAARLASSFAYTTPMVYVPAAAPFHVADGGYFDNTGLFSALRWIDAMEPTLARAERVVLLEIVPFDRPTRWVVKSRWYAAFVAPVALLYRVLFRGQRLASDARLGRLDSERVKTLAVGYLRPPMPVASTIGERFRQWVARIVLGGDGLESEPLSWQLSEHQQDALDRAWDTWWAQNGEEAKRLLGG